MHLRHCLILKLKGISQCDAKKMFVEVVFEALLKKNGCFVDGCTLFLDREIWSEWIEMIETSFENQTKV